MNPPPLFIGIGHASRRKWNQNVCGDVILSMRLTDEDRVIAVLSDGLGSGVKAHILATMTARMALRFAAAGGDFLRAAGVMMEALPVCRERQFSYATFSIVECDQDGAMRVVEEGNPECLVMRGGRPLRIPHRRMASRRFPERSLLVSETRLEPGDRLIVCSDGVTQAGMGSERYPAGWGTEGLLGYLADKLEKDPAVSSRELGREVLAQAARRETGGLVQDDMSCLVLYLRKPRRLLVMTGPPYDRERDPEYAALLRSFPGRKVVCGGTTAELVSREWGRRLEMDGAAQNQAVPPRYRIEGVDLVTEGVLTLEQA
ncbi:MAG: serine/threonine-protein phosphatase, partial [Desulfovibrio sp.]|nr:serine/threonine-protein phosphatase [Desulfovibrio sp.]